MVIRARQVELALQIDEKRKAVRQVFLLVQLVMEICVLGEETFVPVWCLFFAFL